MPHKNLAERKIWQDAYNLAHKEKRNADIKLYWLAHPGGQHEYHMNIGRPKLNKIKLDVLTHYGGGTCQCLHCGESRLACLSLDHIAGNGSYMRKHGLEKRGMGLYADLIKRGYPKGYQTLCMNCQFCKRVLSNELCGAKKKEQLDLIKEGKI